MRRRERETKLETVNVGKKSKGVEEIIRLLGNCDCGNELAFLLLFKVIFKLKS